MALPKRLTSRTPSPGLAAASTEIAVNPLTSCASLALSTSCWIADAGWASALDWCLGSAAEHWPFDGLAVGLFGCEEGDAVEADFADLRRAWQL